MMTGRSILGKIILMLFVVFNVLMLCLTAFAYKLRDMPAKEVREMLRDAIIDEVKSTETAQDALSEERLAELDEILSEFMEHYITFQQLGVQFCISCWVIGGLILGVLTYLTRPQPI